MSKVFIYSLADPTTKEVRYIGKTIDLKMRYRKHLTAKDNSYKTKWLKSLSEPPILRVIEECTDFNWVEREKYWIVKYKYDWEQRLTNLTEGGDGGDTWTGRKHKQSSKDKIGRANKGRKRPDLAIRSKARMSRKVSQYSMDSELVVSFNSVIDASRITGCSKTNISKMANGSLKKSQVHVGGFIWKYD